MTSYLKRLHVRLTAIAFIGLLAACSDDDNGGVAEPLQPANPAPSAELANIAETAASAGSFTTLVTALQATGLDATLADEGSTFTVFAPTDEAFALLGEDTINGLLADTETLSDILLYHVLPGQAVDEETAISLAGSMVEMANGDSVALTLSDGQLFINESLVIDTDIQASNGIIHVIDAVLVPPADVEPVGTIAEVASSNAAFTTLVLALEATDLAAVLADPDQTFTVFAPTDDAFALLGEDTINALLADTDTLADILLYHVFPGQAVDAMTALSLAGTSITMANGDEAALSVSNGELFINGAQVVMEDIMTANGIIHVIDAVITPPASIGSIVDVAVANGSFTTLVTALQETGLDAVLADPDSTFTVFAPTDTAFAALGEDTINALLADTDTLSGILLYHVIPDMAVDSATAISLAGSMVATANGASITLSLSGDTLLVDSAQVILRDVQAENGIIHVIDTVLTPPQ